MTYSALAMPRQPAYRTAKVPTAKPLAMPALSRVVMYVTLGCLLLLVYLVQVTATNAKGYQVERYEEQSAVLQKTHDDLELAGAQARNLDRIQEYGTATGLVAATPQ